MKTEITYATTHSRQAPEYCLARGLYRPLRRTKGQARAKLDVTYTSTNGDCSVRFVGPDQLGADDLAVSQALIALAGPHNRGSVLAPEPKTAAGVAWRTALACTGEARSMDALTVRTTRREIVRELGMAWSAPKGEAVFDSIRRMFHVTVTTQVGSVERGGATLLVYELDKVTGEVIVTLNPWIAAAVSGGAKRYTRVEMDEVRRLRGDAARVLHQHLCALIDAGEARHVRLETLTSYVYPESAGRGSTARMRRAQVRRALDELRRIGWTVATAGGTVQRIGRPAAFGVGRNVDGGGSER